MTTIPFPCVAPVDDEASARRRQLRQRMRVATIAALSSLASLAGIVVYAYVASTALTAFGLLFTGVLTLLEAFRQADRRFIAPLQARCQDDYNRQIDTLLGPLFELRPQPRVERADHVDA
jgi:hypothetical protein